MTEEKKEYTNEGELCSFPYEFILHRKGEEVIGKEVSYIYDQLQFNEEEKKAIEEELAKIHTAKDAAFCLVGNEIHYCIETAGKKEESDLDNEVNIRRNFIENYLEAQQELDALVQKYHGHSKKTEFTK
jgi:hypothetical protein